jgi:hypothetical protein
MGKGREFLTVNQLIEIWADLLPDFYIVHPQMVNGLGVKLVLARLVVLVEFELYSQSQA